MQQVQELKQQLDDPSEVSQKVADSNVKGSFSDKQSVFRTRWVQARAFHRRRLQTLAKLDGNPDEPKAEVPPKPRDVLRGKTGEDHLQPRGACPAAQDP